MPAYFPLMSCLLLGRFRCSEGFAAGGFCCCVIFVAWWVLLRMGLLLVGLLLVGVAAGVFAAGGLATKGLLQVFCFRIRGRAAALHGCSPQFVFCSSKTEEFLVPTFASIDLGDDIWKI